MRVGVQAITEACLGDPPEVTAVKARVDAETAHAESPAHPAKTLVTFSLLHK